LKLILLVMISGCAWAPRSPHYRAQYAHLKKVPSGRMTPSDFQLVILVCARHLDYSHSQGLLKTVAKHPQDGSMSGDVGHTWVLLKGAGEVIEGGHSGELGIDEPKYFDGIMDLVDGGDPNPVRYMHQTLHDGYFEEGAGGFSPTYAIKKELTQQQYQNIRRFMEQYDYTDYSLTNRQCIVFVTEIARMAGLQLKSRVKVPVAQYARVGNSHIKMWTHPNYAELELMSPDVLEKEMMEAVYRGEAEYALDWYRKEREKSEKGIEWANLLERLTKVYLL